MPNPEQSDPGGRIAAATMMTSMVVAVIACFTFSFGNVLELGLFLGAPRWIAGLVDPALAVTVLGLIVGIRYLSGHALTAEEMRPARRLLVFAGVATMLLNIAAAAAQNGSILLRLGAALYDCIAPALLLGWAHVGAWFLALRNGFRRDEAARMATIDQAAAETAAARQARDEALTARDEALEARDKARAEAETLSHEVETLRRRPAETASEAAARPARTRRDNGEETPAQRLERATLEAPTNGDRWTAGTLATAAGVSRATAARYLKAQADRDRNDDGDQIPDTAPYHPEPVPAEHSNGHHDEDN